MSAGLRSRSNLQQSSRKRAVRALFDSEAEESDNDVNDSKIKPTRATEAEESDNDVDDSKIKPTT